MCGGQLGEGRRGLGAGSPEVGDRLLEGGPERRSTGQLDAERCPLGRVGGEGTLLAGQLGAAGPEPPLDQLEPRQVVAISATSASRSALSSSWSSSARSGAVDRSVRR